LLNEISCGAISSWLDPVLLRSMLESDVSTNVLDDLDSKPAEFLDTDSGRGDLVGLLRLELLDRGPLNGLPWLAGGISEGSEYLGGKYDEGVGEEYVWGCGYPGDWYVCGGGFRGGYV